MTNDQILMTKGRRLSLVIEAWSLVILPSPGVNQESGCESDLRRFVVLEHLFM